MKTFETTSELAALPQVQSFVFSQAEAIGCSREVLRQIKLAVEEVFVNISNYAYGNSVGTVTVSVGTDRAGTAVLIRFSDSGSPFDPLASNTEPDLDAPVKVRQKGGLGIFMVKRVMDEVAYEYKDGHNILTIKKQID